ncbi:MAG: triose-phosphate isomerase [Gemmatimonadetes bacterium]|nr:triose-phosphate isomerase [Gemmatimonadota bacterium]
MAAHRRPILAANWKMNHGPTAASAFLASFLARYARREDRTVILFPSALAFAAARSAVAERPDVLLGVQNIYSAEKGAFTGENSAAIALDAGAGYVLVGHSERRHVFGETDAQSAEKVKLAAAHGLVPVLCVGEKIEEREAGQTDAVCVRQLRAAFAGLPVETLRDAIVAYEPVWAIGTGRTATPQDASAAHQAIRAELRALAGDAGAAIPILYGGSVNAGNAATLLSAPGVDGLLVGGASLEADSWLAICTAEA